MIRTTIIAIAFGALSLTACQSKGGLWSNPNRTETDSEHSVREHAQKPDQNNTGAAGSAQGHVDAHDNTAPSSSTPGAGTPSSSATGGNASGNDAAPQGDTTKPGGSR